MTQSLALAPHVQRTAAEPESQHTRLKFGDNGTFQAELRRRVDAYMQQHGIRPRDCWQMYLKSAILLGTAAASYTLLVFFASTWWQALPLSLLLGLAVAGIGFNIMHDAGHGAYSKHPWINKLMSMTLDMVGGSSYIWHWNHAVFHHTYVNITEHDTDVELGKFARLTPHQKRRFFHRWQHFYLWPLYGMLAIKWHLISDFYQVIVGRIGRQSIPRPKGWDLVVFLGGKAVFFTLAFAIPLMVHSVWIVVLFYALISIVLGMVLSIVFLLAHVVDNADFPVPNEQSGRMEHSWAVHQIETPVDFTRGSRIAAWLLGGLNFQIEHHLFAKICHVNYPAISKVVEETCREYGVRYREHRTFFSGMVSHFRWLRLMGLAPQT